MDGATTTLPAGPVVAPSSRKRKQEGDKSQAVFLEFFAGTGVLTEAVRRVGVACGDPNDVATGGTDFRVHSQVENLKEELTKLAGQTRHLFVHLAPPCATFSRARDRSIRTRLRNKWYPEGLPGKETQTREANGIARRAYKLACWAADELGAKVTLENPRKSYLWQFVSKFDSADTVYSDLHFSPCLHGASYQKPTTLRCWNWKPAKLEGVCSLSGGVFTCGRTQAEGHTVLEFGGAKTHEAAEYAAGVCEKWAYAIGEEAAIDVNPEISLEAVELTDAKVKRHKSRGTDQPSSKETRNIEDEASMAGMRNPTDLEEKWPRLWATMARVRKCLTELIQEDEELQELSGSCGDNPKRKPPSEEKLLKVRAVLADELGVAHDEVDAHHPSAPWRHALVYAVQVESADPDLAMAGWLREGAPMGLDAAIEPGHLFPKVEPKPEKTLEELDAEERWQNNHPSFELLHGGGEPPGVELIKGYVEKKMGKLFQSVKEAEAFVGTRIHPAPMGNVTTVKNGKLKHRVIQDLKANAVNSAVVLPERQVLPRGIDHALDMARLSVNPSPREDLSVLILDYKDAFMSIPLDAREMKYNCSVLSEPIQREREEIYEGEPLEGKCIMWNVLGFGGKPNPLVYSRVASFAIRTAQALFSKKATSGPRLRSQLYVDDPALTARGTKKEVTLAFDLVLLWWMSLGIPLAWAKGAVSHNKEEHDWIGVRYRLVKPGEAEMALPTKYLKELLEVLEPFCQLKGKATLKEAQKMVGKASRVAQVIPAARPFVSGLWAALTATRADAHSGTNKTRGARVATRRFCTSARWFRALVEGDSQALLPLRRRVLASRPTKATTSGWVAQFDASTTGGGAILRCNHKVVEFFYVKWESDTAAVHEVIPGKSRFQSFWEFLTLLLCLMVWGKDFTKQRLAVLGDNTAALSNALQLKGKGALAAVARELAWRQERNEWSFEVGHVPSEMNIVPDALSRQFEEKPSTFPHEALKGATRRHPPMKDVWKAVAR